MITKKQLREKFNSWLGDEFDNKNKKSKGETHRWILCYNGEYKESNLNFDCACCLTEGELDKCGCYCHSRIGEIVDFFWKELFKIEKRDEVDFSSYDAINSMQDDIVCLLKILGLKDCARDISPHKVMIDEIIPAVQALQAGKNVAVKTCGEKLLKLVKHEVVFSDSCYTCGNKRRKLCEVRCGSDFTKWKHYYLCKLCLKKMVFESFERYEELHSTSGED